MKQHIIYISNLTPAASVAATALLCLLISMLSQTAFAQEQKKESTSLENPYADQARSLIVEGTEAMINQEGGVVDFNAFAKAESNLRAAISLTPESVPAKYNAGNNYYKNKKWEESTAALVKATAVAQTKKEKHKSFHNLGNALFQQKQWDGAVEAYKNALRADPTDEETRYNLQLAKKEKENEGGGGSDNDDKENKDEDNKEDENKKNEEGDGDKKEGEDGDKDETDDKGEEKEDGEKKEDDKGKPEDKDKKQDGGEGKEDKKQPPPQPKQGQLSPQQVQSLLKAMQDQEKKTQEKVNAQKVKGAQVKTEKDW